MGVTICLGESLYGFDVWAPWEKPWAFGRFWVRPQVQCTAESCAFHFHAGWLKPHDGWWQQVQWPLSGWHEDQGSTNWRDQAWEEGECMALIYSVCVLSRFSRGLLIATPWTVACQAPLSMGFPRQEYWSGLPCPPPGDLPYPGIEPVFLKSPALASVFFTTNATWEALIYSWGQQTMAWQPDPAHHQFLQIKFYWNPVPSILLLIAYGCFHAKMEELSSHNRDHMSCKAQKIYYLALYRKNLAVLWSIECTLTSVNVLQLQVLGFPDGTVVKNLPAKQKTWVWSLGSEDPLEAGMATYSSILAWEIPWTEEPGGLQSIGSQRVGHAWVTNTFTFLRV